MPVEIIGEVGTPGADREWIVAQATLAVQQIVKACGQPPPEMELEIQWQEHDLGEYPTIVLSWEDAMRGTPWDYIQKCQDALCVIDGGEVPPRWSLVSLDSEAPEDEAISPDPDFPKEPGPGASFFEVQEYLSRLIAYSVNSTTKRA